VRGQKSPDPAVRAIVAIVAHHEIVPLGHTHRAVILTG
jgi:hypothetical protein